MNVCEYKGYRAQIKFDERDLTFHGKIAGIKDFVNFECDRVEDIEKEFHSAVDDYLIFCENVGKEPDNWNGGIE